MSAVFKNEKQSFIKHLTRPNEGQGHLLKVKYIHGL